MNEVHVVEVKRMDAGGRCYIYYGKFNNGKYFVWFEDVFSILNTDYEESFRAKGGFEWSCEHTIATIKSDYMWHFISEIKILLGEE